MNNKLEVLYTVLEVLIALACCLGNLLVIWAVWMCGAMRRQPTFCFIASLAIADFLVGAVALPLAVLVDGRVRTSFYSCVALCSVVTILSLASVHSLLAIALDRFLRVFIPLRYKRTVTQMWTWTAVGVCWFSANRVHSHVCGSGASGSGSHTYYQKERKLALSLLLVLVLFAVGWLPLILMRIASFYGATVPHQAFHVGDLLSHANSAVNPVVYALKVQKLRSAFHNIWKRYVLCKKDRETTTISQT